MTLTSLAKSFWPLFLLVGCATDIDYKIPSHRFVDPETRGTSVLKGEYSGFGQFSYQSNTKHIMTEVYDLGVFGTSINEDQAFEKTGNMGLQAGLGIIPEVDFIYRDNGDSPRMGLLKVQILGSGFNKLQEEFKLAFWAGLGSMNEDEGVMRITNENQSELFNGRIEVSPWELGFSFGQRLSSRSLAYMNIVYAKYASESKLTSTSRADTTITGDIKQQAIALGLKLHQQHISCHIEAGYTQIEWDDSLEHKMASLGVGVSVEF
jgi:hypothetical protein